MIRASKRFKALIMSMFMFSTLITFPVNTSAATSTDLFPEIITFENGEVDEALNYKLDKGDVTTSIVDNNGSKALAVEYSATDWPGIKFQPKNSEAWDLGTDGAVSFEVTNPEDSAQSFYIKLDETDPEGSGNDTSITYTANVGAGETKTFHVALGEIPSLGMATVPPNETGSLASYGWGKKDIDLSNITQITLWKMYNSEVTTLIYDNIKIIENPTKDLSYLNNILDEYGQYTKKDWENKVESNEDITGDIADEDRWLDEQINAIDQSGKYTQYGGYKNEEYKQEATGKFYPTKIDGKWTLIDPEGYPFIATGLDIIRTADMLTWVSGRENMFENLPTKDGEFGEHYTDVTGVKPPAGYEGKVGDGFNFYTANLERKYGDDYIADWTETTLKRFKAWEFTSLGCWADPNIYFGQGNENKMAYVANGWVHEGETADAKYARVKNLSRGGEIADPFDPNFRKAAEEMAKNIAAQGVNDDQWCYGIYVDNEIDWGNGNLTEQHYSIVDGAFSVDATDLPAKRVFIEILKGKYATIADLNEVWGTAFSSFDDLNAPYTDTAKIPVSDKSDMLYAIADEYYRIVDETLETYLPNVLNLGSRLAEWGTSEEIVDACTKYVDVISFNCYKADVNQPWMDFERYDKPVIIGEFHFNAMDSGFFAPGLQPVDSQAERGAAYSNYMESVFGSSQFVGAQWFQYYDQPILGRAWDGENTNAGFVDVADQPYQPLVDAAKATNANGYEMKFGFVNAEKVQLSEENITLTKEVPSTTLTATVLPENATNKQVEWKSSNEAVVTVDANGVVTAVGEGAATIMVVSKNNSYVIDTCGVVVSDFEVDESTTPVVFDKIDFESEEVSYDMAVAGEGNATTEIIDVDGNKVLNVTLDKLSGVNDLSSTVDFTPKEGNWSFGEGNKLHLDITNPNDYKIQARVNLKDVNGVIGTYYFNMAANESRTITIDNFGAADDNWGDPDGFWGLGTALDTTNINLVSVYLWEDVDAALPDPTTSFIVDNIYIEQPVVSNIDFDKVDFESEDVSYDMAVAGEGNATTEIVNVDGNKVLNVTLDKLSGVNDLSSTVDFTPKDGNWSFGEGNKLHLDITNPNAYKIQARVNLKDANGVIGTYYFNMAANESRTITIDNFGAADDNWGDPDGFWGLGTALDTTNINLVSVYLWEDVDAGLPDPTTSFIVDNICVEEVSSEGPEVEDVLATTVTLDKEELELFVDGEATLVATVNPVDSTDKTVAWSSSNEAVATVDSEGNVTAIAVGEAYIGVVSNANSFAKDYCKVTVKSEEVTTPNPDPETDGDDDKEPVDPETDPDDDDKEPVKPEPDTDDKEEVTPDKDDNLPETGGVNSIYTLMLSIAVIIGGVCILSKKKRYKEI